MTLIEQEYMNDDGIRRLVGLPKTSTPLDEGVPLSARLDEKLLERGCSVEFIKVLYNELWALGLIKPADYDTPSALNLITRALQAALKVDANSVRAIALEQMKTRK